MKWEIGVRAHDFGRMPLSELAPKIADAGFSHIQLALGKALNDFKYSCGVLSNGLARSIEKERHHCPVPTARQHRPILFYQFQKSIPITDMVLGTR